MTDTPQIDDELFRVLIERTLLLETEGEPVASLRHDFGHETLSYNTAARICAEFIQADREARELEIRIDELKRLDGYTDSGWGVKGLAEDDWKKRIAKLESKKKGK